MTVHHVRHGRRMPAGHVPAGGPATIVVWPAEVESLVFAVLGVQSPTREAAAPVVGELRELLAGTSGPGHVERALHVHDDDRVDDILLCYWTSPDAFGTWWQRPDVEAWWNRAGDIGQWAEVTTTPVTRHETMYSAPGALTGPAGLGFEQGLSDVHAYRGAFVDRFDEPTSPGCDLAGLPGLDRSVQRSGPLCLIRTEQDWSQAPDEQRAAYLDEVRPALDAAVRRLHSHPAETGCLAAMALRMVDLDTGADLDRTCVLGWWPSHDSLDNWAATEPTHLKILQDFWEKLVGPFGMDLRVLLWHEVGLPSTVAVGSAGKVTNRGLAGTVG